MLIIYGSLYKLNFKFVCAYYVCIVYASASYTEA